MGISSKPGGGQRRSTTGQSGQKVRTPTSNPHVGSRVEPSHSIDKTREDRQWEIAARVAKKAKKKTKKR